MHRKKPLVNFLNKIKNERLKKDFFRLDNRLKSFLAFVIFLFLVYFFACFIFSFIFHNRADASFSEPTVVYSNTGIGSLMAGQELGSESFIFNSFFDSFANSYLIDSNGTNLYRDNSATAVFFPPNYSWSAADSATISQNANKFSNFIFDDFSAIPDEKICLEKMGNKCLEQKNNQLYFDGKAVAWPKDIKEANIAAVSLGSLETHWLVGITLKEGDSNYSGQAYYFDGKNFSALGINGKISSPYFGLFGFGGIDSDFLVVYGAYGGIAYRIQNNNVTDLSKFFDYRIMSQGYRPAIIRAEGGGNINWYVFSLTATRPHLIKLWQNDNGLISGEMEYQNLFSDGDNNISFSLLSADAGSFKLLAKIKNGDNYNYKILNDFGFKNQTVGTLSFVPNVYDKPVTLEKLANSSLGSPDLLCSEGKLMFSLDNTHWQTVPLGQNLNQSFRFDSVDKFFLRVDLAAQTNKFYSPFLNEVLFDLYYQK